MKKFLWIALVLLLTVSATVACQSGDNNGTDTTDPVSDAETTTGAETEASNVSDKGVVVEGLNGWFEYAGNLTHRDKYEYIGTRDSMDIAMAKNEMEGFQYVLLADENYDDLRCEVSTLTDGNGNSLEGTVYVVWDFYFKSALNYPIGFTPFMLLEQDDPYQGGTFDVIAMRAKTVYVQYQTDINTVPGIYTGTLEIKQGETVLKRHSVSVKVWNIYYEEKTECLSNYGCGYWPNDGGAGGAGPAEAPSFEDAGVEEKYYDFLIANRLGVSSVPCAQDGSFTRSVLNDTAAKYLDNPRVNSVWLPYQDGLAAQYEEALKHEGWLDKIFFAVAEEPSLSEQIDSAKEFALNVIKPQFNTTRFSGCFDNVAPWMFPEEGPNILERMAEYSTLHIIESIAVVDGPVKDTIRELQSQGHTVMWYVCGNQGNRADLVNLLPTTPGTEMRVLFWQQYQNDIDGFYYFNTARWNTQTDNNPWEEGYGDKKFKPKKPTIENAGGDGVLVYWHPVTGDPVSTLPLEANRDGIEDFQLLRMVEYALGKEVAMTYAERITTANNVYTKDPVLLAQVRMEMGDALEAALAS